MLLQGDLTTAQLSHLASGRREWGVSVRSYFLPTLKAHRQATQVGEREKLVPGGGRRLSHNIDVACT